MRAAALAASQPAWPPPITMTSNFAHIFSFRLECGVVAEAPGRVKTLRFCGMFHVKHRKNGIELPMICRLLGYERGLLGTYPAILGPRGSILMPTFVPVATRLF